MKKRCLISTFLTVICIATAASAAWTPITNLVSISSLQDGSLTFGDKKVSHINLAGSAIGGALVPTADSVSIQGGQDSTTGDYGLRFVLVSWVAGSNQAINADIHFSVSVLPGYDNYIKDVGMNISGASATGSGVIAVGETVRNAPLPDGSIIASISCSQSANDNGAFLEASREFTPVKEIWIWSKDISITGGTNGSAHMSEFYQFYSQTQVPEPATITLLCAGALALLKRKNK